VKLHESLILAVNGETTLRSCLRNLSSFLKSSSREPNLWRDIMLRTPRNFPNDCLTARRDNITQVCRRSFAHSPTKPQSELLIAPVSCFREFHRDHHRAILSRSKVSSRHVNCLIVIVASLEQTRWCYHSMSIISQYLHGARLSNQVASDRIVECFYNSSLSLSKTGAEIVHSND